MKNMQPKVWSLLWPVSSSTGREDLAEVFSPSSSADILIMWLRRDRRNCLSCPSSTSWFFNRDTMCLFAAATA
ncbi:hypothetical protein E2C01_005981 [Portunus trituberculatus]|uniref:Uncharacterized protein n=1 Tax=Portunus trituberculatus TaxID=210409 RepID=A0A5B7CVV7_PORTR|nr:hypothetical protein [Portunus trituberculatus]